MLLFKLRFAKAHNSLYMVLRAVIVSINSVGLNETGDYSWLTITIVNQELQLLTQKLQLFH